MIIGVFSKSKSLFTLISWSLNSIFGDINEINSFGLKFFFLSERAKGITLELLVYSSFGIIGLISPPKLTIIFFEFAKVLRFSWDSLDSKITLFCKGLPLLNEPIN